MSFRVVCFHYCQLDQQAIIKKGQKQGLETDWEKFGEGQQVENKTRPWQA